MVGHAACRPTIPSTASTPRCPRDPNASCAQGNKLESRHRHARRARPCLHKGNSIFRFAQTDSQQPIAESFPLRRREVQLLAHRDKFNIQAPILTDPRANFLCDRSHAAAKILEDTAGDYMSNVW
jgi:hypothetical protein